jgi:outer membrane protein OmpA-like peptidoglycan-associated protein
MKRLLQLVFILFFNFLSAQETVYEILNTSINSEFADLGVTYSINNSVIFASSKKKKSGRRTNNRQLSLELYHGLIAENGDIIQTDKFSNEINNKFFESDIAFTPDFKTIYFTWNNYYSALKSDDSAKWKTLYMFKGSINENFQISNIRPLPFNSKEYSVRSPTVSKDGKKLYFISDMPGGFGETDIYVVDISNGINFGAPKNLGPAVNSKNAELFPYIDENNTLYFSSDGHNGQGGLDIFKSEFIDGNYQQAENLQKPFNSKYDDFYFVINKASNSGYFTSNRAGGKGGVDIYAFKEKKEICTQSITILTLDQSNLQALEKVTVSLFQDNTLIEKQTIAKNSNYKFNIECDKTYKMVAEKENYETAELSITTDDKYDVETSKTLKLTPVECVQLLSGTVVDSKTNLPIDQVTVSLFQNNRLLEKQTISKNSNYKFNIECDKTYKIVAEKENYETAEWSITTDDKNDVETSKIVKLTPIECVQLLSGTVMDSKTNLPIDKVQVSLFQNNRLVEKQTISGNSNYKFNIECDKTYKIVAEKENYETAELSITTDGKYNVETSKTVKLTPIECVQLLSGTVLDSKTNLPIDKVQVSLFQNNRLIDKQTISINSNYKFNIECNKTYKIVAEKENYGTAELSITTDDTYDVETSKTVKLTPIECVQLLSGTVVDEETNLPLPNAIVSIYSGNELLERLPLDARAIFNYKLSCGTQYRITVSLKNYHDAVSRINTSDQRDETLNMTWALESSVEFVEVFNQKMIKTKVISFDLNQSSIKLDAAIELNRVIGILMKYPNLKIEIKSHTDSRAPSDYNMKLSNERAKTVIDYIVSNGIDSGRVSGRGYGETQLLNNCSKGVKCSEAEHQINRRTEFIIIDE